MPNTPVPAAGEAMPAVEGMPIIGRFSGRVLLGAVAEQMAEAARQIELDAASIASALAIIHGGKYRVEIEHQQHHERPHAHSEAAGDAQGHGPSDMALAPE